MAVFFKAIKSSCMLKHCDGAPNTAPHTDALPLLPTASGQVPKCLLFSTPHSSLLTCVSPSARQLELHSAKGLSTKATNSVMARGDGRRRSAGREREERSPMERIRWHGLPCPSSVARCPSGMAAPRGSSPHVGDWQSPATPPTSTCRLPTMRHARSPSLSVSRRPTPFLLPSTYLIACEQGWWRQRW